jgi:hypothetical protein
LVAEAIIASSGWKILAVMVLSYSLIWNGVTHSLYRTMSPIRSQNMAPKNALSESRSDERYRPNSLPSRSLNRRGKQAARDAGLRRSKLSPCELCEAGEWQGTMAGQRTSVPAPAGFGEQPSEAATA